MSLVSSTNTHTQIRDERWSRLNDLKSSKVVVMVSLIIMNLVYIYIYKRRREQERSRPLVDRDCIDNQIVEAVGTVVY